MSNTEISLILSIFSAALSIITFILSFPRIRREARGKLVVNSSLSNDRKHIDVHLANASFNRVVTILALEIHYGSMPDYKQLVLSVPVKPVSLKESDPFNYKVEIEQLKKGVLANKVEQRYYSVLWIKVITATSGNPIKKVRLPEKYFENNIHTKAEKFMATDELLGFKLMEPVYSVFSRPGLVK